MNKKLSEITKELLAIHNRRPRKHLGQNFLINQEILDRIITASELSLNDTVIEIGTGLGVLTNELAEKANKVITIDCDKELLRISKDILTKHTNIKYIDKDILDLDLKEELKDLNYKVVANLPYYIAAPIIIKFLEAENKPELMVLTIQKEVAQRIAAPPGSKTYGSFSVFCQFYGEIELVSLVPKFAFYPQPNVSSAVVKIRPYKESPWGNVDIKRFFEITRSAFGQRRKKLRNTLKDFGLDEEKFDLTRRPEQLSVKEFVELTTNQPHPKEDLPF